MRAAKSALSMRSRWGMNFKKASDKRCSVTVALERPYSPLPQAADFDPNVDVDVTVAVYCPPYASRISS